MASCRPARMVFLFVILLPALCQAAGFTRIGGLFSWDRIDHSARSTSMAGADLATAGGPSALWQTPAPLPEDHMLQASLHRFSTSDYVTIYTMALAGEMGPVRFGICHSRQVLDDSGTIYYPTGTDFSDVANTISVAGAGVDMEQLLSFDHRNLQWTAGIGGRYYYRRIADDSGSGLGIDLGTTMRWVKRVAADRWYGLSAAVAGRNILGTQIITDELPHFAPQDIHTGCAVDCGFGRTRHSDTVKLLLAYTRRQSVGDRSDDLLNADLYGGVRNFWTIVFRVDL